MTGNFKKILQFLGLSLLQRRTEILYIFNVTTKFELPEYVSAARATDLQSLRYERVLRIIQGYFFLFFNQNIYCDPSIRLDATVLMMGRKICSDAEIWIITPVTPSYLEHCDPY